MSQKVAYVTGGMGGIGTAICQRLHDDGFKVIAGCGPTRDYTKWLDEQKALGYTFYASVGNVGDWESTVEAFSKTKAEHGSIDVLVNNAGITRDGLLMRMDEDAWDLVLKINLKGTFLMSKAVVRTMLKQKGGSVINIASVIGLMGNAGQANYAASKAGIIGFTKSFAKEFGRKGIRSNAIAPGFINSDMTAVLPDKVKEQMLAQIPLNSFGNPRDVANAVVFLASDKASYITGQVLTVDGGMVMS